MHGHWDIEAKPYRVTWLNKSGEESRERHYASEDAARAALAAPFGALEYRAVLERMETREKGAFYWIGVRMASRSRRPTDKRVK